MKKYRQTTEYRDDENVRRTITYWVGKSEPNLVASAIRQLADANRILRRDLETANSTLEMANEMLIEKSRPVSENIDMEAWRKSLFPGHHNTRPTNYKELAKFKDLINELGIQSICDSVIARGKYKEITLEDDDVATWARKSIDREKLPIDMSVEEFEYLCAKLIYDEYKTRYNKLLKQKQNVEYARATQEEVIKEKLYKEYKKKKAGNK